jgi:hypothetical protein
VVALPALEDEMLEEMGSSAFLLTLRTRAGVEGDQRRERTRAGY